MTDELVAPSPLTAEESMRLLGAALEPELMSVAADPEAGTAFAVHAYLDTFDGRLAAAGLAAVHVRPQRGEPAGRLAVVDRASGAERASEAMPLPSGALLAIDLEPGPVRDALLPVVDVRALLELVELEVTRAPFVVRDALGKIVTRIWCEYPVLAGSRKPLPLRVRLEPLRGYRDETARVAARGHEAGFGEPRRPLVAEAVLAEGGDPAGTSSKIQVALLASQRSDAAAVAVLRRLLEVIEDNLGGTLADLDAEFLHDLRVAVRRTRSVQRELRAVFPPDRLAYYRGEFRWLQAATGPVRDLDVYVLEWDAMLTLLPESMRGDLTPVLQVLTSRRDVARRALVRDLRSPRMNRLRREWEAFLEELVALPVDDRPQAPRAIGELAGERIAKVYRRMVSMGRAIDSGTPAEAYHEVRKKGKELRYLLELFGTPLFPEDVVKPMVKSLKALQDVLGRHQDREVQQVTLREIAEPVSSMPGRTGALMAMGVLLERLREDEVAARAEFAEVFAAFSDKSLRQTVKATFL